MVLLDINLCRNRDYRSISTDPFETARLRPLPRPMRSVTKCPQLCESPYPHMSVQGILCIVSSLDIFFYQWGGGLIINARLGNGERKGKSRNGKLEIHNDSIYNN